MSNIVYKYRYLNMPSDETPEDQRPVLDIMPIFPASFATSKHVKHDYHREIAWSVDYKGDNDDIPTLIYIGAGLTLIKKVFRRISKRGYSIIRGAYIYREDDFYLRQGKAHERVFVELSGFDDYLMSVEDFGNIMQRLIEQECFCNIQYVKLEKLLNL